MRTDRRKVIRSGIGVALTMALGGTTPEDALAAQAPVKLKAPDNPPTLRECLPHLDWDPAERGPLLIVAPDRAKLQGEVRSINYDIPRRTERIAVRDAVIW